MTTPKYTPGPWHVSNGVQIRSEKHQLAKVWMMRNGEGVANAQLIAAAPELLEALDTLCNGLEWMIENRPTIMDESDCEALNMARAVIAKATGADNAQTN